MKRYQAIATAVSATLWSTAGKAAIYTQVNVSGTASQFDCGLSGLNCANVAYPLTATFNFGADATDFFDGLKYAFLTSTGFSGGMPTTAVPGFDFRVNFNAPINLSLPGQNIFVNRPPGSFDEVVSCGGGRTQCTIFGPVLSFNLRTSDTSFGAEGMTYSSGSFIIPDAAAPEPATWLTMVIGFGAAGFALRRQTRFAIA